MDVENRGVKKDEKDTWCVPRLLRWLRGLGVEPDSHSRNLKSSQPDFDSKLDRFQKQQTDSELRVQQLRDELNAIRRRKTD